jgi:Mg/Co/Ni transporter MgtE
MHTATELLPAEITVREALERVRPTESRTWLVTDRRGVVGVINLSKLERELAEGADKKLGELVDALVFPHVHSDHAAQSFGIVIEFQSNKTGIDSPQCGVAGKRDFFR